MTEEFQFYKVRLKRHQQPRRRSTTRISILQSSIKTLLAIIPYQHLVEISILQSSIKTCNGLHHRRRRHISILQSSIKTRESFFLLFFRLPFQFYKVRLKLVMLRKYSFISLFQFYKVRLKPTGDGNKTRALIFQFYKVRLKLARSLLRPAALLDFNSTKFD